MIPRLDDINDLWKFLVAGVFRARCQFGAKASAFRVKLQRRAQFKNVGTDGALMVVSLFWIICRCRIEIMDGERLEIHFSRDCPIIQSFISHRYSNVR